MPEHAKPSLLKRAGRYLLTILVLTIVSSLVEHLFGPEQRERFRELDRRFLAQLHTVEPFNLASLYYNYVLTGHLPDPHPAPEPTDFAARWRAHSTPPSAPSNSAFFANILAGPFAVLLYSWSAGVAAFLATLFGLILGTILWWQTEMNLFVRILLIPITGSIAVWLIWIVALAAANLFGSILDLPAILASVPFAAALGHTVIEERQHHLVTHSINHAFHTSAH